MKKNSKGSYKLLIPFLCGVIAFAIWFGFGAIFPRADTPLAVNASNALSEAGGSGKLFEQLGTSNSTSQVSRDVDQYEIGDDAICKKVASTMKDQKDWLKFDQTWRVKLDNANPAVEQALDKISGSKNLLENASALYLNSQLQSTKAAEVFMQSHPECEADAHCMKKLFAVQNVSAAPRINEIAKLAIYSDDPSLYAVAFNACSNDSVNKGGYCGQINAAQWANRDPNNGIAWIHLLNELATEPKSRSSGAIDNALYRLSQAKYFSPGFVTLSNLKNSQFLRMDDQFAQIRLKELAANAWNEQAAPAYFPILSACKGAELNTLNRRETCNQIAGKMLRDDSLLTDFPIAVKMAENLAWDPKRIAAMKDEMDAIRGLQVLDERKKSEVIKASPPQLHNCQTFLKAIGKVEETMHNGELKQGRLDLELQKKSRSELAEIYREEYKRILADPKNNFYKVP